MRMVGLFAKTDHDPIFPKKQAKSDVLFSTLEIYFHFAFCKNENNKMVLDSNSQSFQIVTTKLILEFKVGFLGPIFIC